MLKLLGKQGGVAPRKMLKDKSKEEEKEKEERHGADGQAEKKQLRDHDLIMKGGKNSGCSFLSDRLVALVV
jgi:general stress protein YciG